MNLFNIPILATALSIVIAWALFALFCSYLHEAIVQAKAERGRFLKQYLLKQLQDLPNDVNWASMLYMHGTVDMLSRAPEKPTSDIAPELFARTLIEVAGNAHIVQMRMGAKVKLSYNNPLLKNFEAAIKVLQPSDVVTMFKQSFSDAELKAMVDGKVDEGKLYQELVNNIVQWYNELQGRISVWYKKATRVRLFFLAAIVALVINVDSIQLFQYFSGNPTARNTVIDYYAKNQAGLEQQAVALDKVTAQDTVNFKRTAHALDTVNSRLSSLKKGSNLPAASTSAISGYTQSQNRLQQQLDSVRTVEHRDSTNLKQALSKVKAAADSLDAVAKKAGLPIGASRSIIFKKQGLDFGGVLLKLLGIAISGIAASFGAPFWFDVLKKVYTPTPKK